MPSPHLQYGDRHRHAQRRDRPTPWFRASSRASGTRPASASPARAERGYVACALKRLGAPVVCTGPAGGRTGTLLAEELTNEGILNDPSCGSAAIRRRSLSTEINHVEPGH